MGVVVSETNFSSPPVRAMCDAVAYARDLVLYIWSRIVVPLRPAAIAKRLIIRFGLPPDVFVLPLAIVIGIVTSFLSVAFHELIQFIRDHLYLRSGPELLYGRGMFLLVAIPAAGGLVVGLLSRYVLRAKEGHGVVDVMESVILNARFRQTA